MAGRIQRELALLVTGKDVSATKTLRTVNKELGKLGKIGSRGVGKTVQNVERLGTAAAGLAIGGLAASVKVAADFESQLNTINTVAQRTPEQLDEIGRSIRQIARDTGAPLEELTQGFYDLVSAGIAADQANKVLAASNVLAIGGLATAAESVDLMTTALNSYGVAAQDQGAESQRFADIFAKAIERGKVTASELAASFAQIGPLAAANGIEIEELAAAYAQLTAKGVPASEAATQMTSALIALMRRTGALEKLEKATGKSYLSIAGKKGLVVALEQLRQDAAKAGVPLIDLLGRIEGLNFTVNTTGESLEGYNENLEAMSDAQGTAARQMAERQKGLNFQLERLKALARDAGITIGAKLIPKLVPLGERAIAFLETHQDDIERFGDEIAGGFDKAAQFAEKIPWAQVGSGLKTAAQWAGILMDAFMDLPPDVQTTLIALAGLNKLSGGAITGIVSELGKGLIKGVLSMTAAVVNINAGVVRGGGAPGTGGAAAGGGGRGGAGTALLVGGAAVGLATGVASDSPILVRDVNADDQQRIAAGIVEIDRALEHQQRQGATADQRLLASLNAQKAALQAGDISLALAIRDGTITAAEGMARLRGESQAGTSAQLSELGRNREAVSSLKSATQSGMASQLSALGRTREAISGVTSAINAKDLSVHVSNSIAVYSTVSIRDVHHQQITHYRYGSVIR
jgi:TP901 family phage tail tape measure protein